MRNILVVTGGAGFIGSNLIELLLQKTKYKIISLDNYSSGLKKNHMKSKRVTYLHSNTANIDVALKAYRKKINAVFHLGEFARIYQSFLKFNECFHSNSIGSKAVFKFCLDHNIKLIYSATSASLGNGGMDKNLSPYAFTKAKNLELLENLKKWFGFRYEIVYFYNVYGPGQIKKGSMATVIGIFEDQFKKKIPLTIVRPGSQSRRFTHVLDTVDACYYAWKKNMCQHYSVSHKKSYTIIEVAKMFHSKIKLIPARKGERYASALTSMNLSNKVCKIFGKSNLRDYIDNIVKTPKKH